MTARLTHDPEVLPRDIRDRLTVYDDKADWLAHRRKVLTGSDVAALLGMSKWRSPWDVWMDKCHPPEEPEEDKAIWRRGRFLESAVMEYVRCERSDAAHVLWAPHPDVWAIVDGGPGLGLFSASPDGITLSATGGILRGEECKSVGYSAKGDWIVDNVFTMPVRIQAQCRLYSIVLGIPWRAHAYVMPDIFETVDLPRDAELERFIIDTCTAWWERHVIGNEAPPMDGSGTARQYLLDHYERQEGESREATPDEHDDAAAYRAAAEAEKAAKASKATLRNRLLSSMAGIPRLTLDGRPLVSINAKGAISVKRTT